MQLALEQARMAALCNEVPIGAVIVHRLSQQVIAKAHNLTKQSHDPTAHAELIALRQACLHLQAQRIPECDLYVTLEPCPMCTSAISYARINHVYFGATDAKSGGFISGPNLCTHPVLHHKVSYTKDIMADESASLLQNFFKARR